MKRPRRAQSFDLDPRIWGPIEEAFEQTSGRLRSGILAARYLERHLHSGELRLAHCHVEWTTGKATGGPVELSFVRKLKLGVGVYAPSEGDKPPALIIKSTDGKAVPGRFYLHRADWDKLSPSPSRSPERFKPPQRRRGPVVVHDWFSICGEIARRCIDPKTGLVRVPESENKLAEDVLDWLAKNEKNTPAPSEMREAVKRVCAALETAQK